MNQECIQTYSTSQQLAKTLRKKAINTTEQEMDDTKIQPTVIDVPATPAKQAGFFKGSVGNVLFVTGVLVMGATMVNTDQKPAPARKRKTTRRKSSMNRPKKAPKVNL